MFTTAIAVIIVAVPEGLPLAVSISMAYSSEKMQKDNILIKRAEAYETMGTITEICTGKSGTLTANDMKVNCYYTAGQMFANSKDNTLVSSEHNYNLLNLIVEGVLYNCDARIEMTDKAMYEPVGNGTECGMLRFLQKNNVPVHDMLKRKVGKIISDIPFDAVTKKMTIAMQHPDNEDVVRVYVKGAPEYVIDNCKYYLNANA
jgi:Ca2+ transporting ATPase